MTTLKQQDKQLTVAEREMGIRMIRMEADYQELRHQMIGELGEKRVEQIESEVKANAGY